MAGETDTHGARKEGTGLEGRGKGCCKGIPALGRAGADSGESLGGGGGEGLISLQGVLSCPHLGPSGLAAFSQRIGGGCIPGTGSHRHWHMPSSGPPW